MLSQLRHPHIVAFLAACTEPPSICIVEELVAGGSLHDRLHGRHPRRRKERQQQQRQRQRPLSYTQVGVSGWQSMMECRSVCWLPCLLTQGP